MSTPRLSVSFSPEYPLIPHLRQVSAAADNSDLLQPLLASAERRALLAFPDSTASCTLLHSSEPPIATCFSKPLPRLPLEYLIDALNEHFALEVDRVSQHIRETNKSIEGYKNAQHDRLQKQRERFVTQYKYVHNPIRLLSMSTQSVRQSSISDATRQKLEQHSSSRPGRTQCAQGDDKGVTPMFIAVREILERSQLEVCTITQTIWQDKLDHALQQRPDVAELLKEGISTGSSHRL
ncbi:hypothetical protein E4T56_gene10714 [Termitomyces sp. T112]|nr:hypothetical protein E4T56_gene10714 [Termitomyces sp. T112]